MKSEERAFGFLFGCEKSFLGKLTEDVMVTRFGKKTSFYFRREGPVWLGPHTSMQIATCRNLMGGLLLLRFCRGDYHIGIQWSIILKVDFYEKVKVD